MVRGCVPMLHPSGSEFSCLMKTDYPFPPLSGHSTVLGELKASGIEKALGKALPGRFSAGLSFFLRRNEFDVIVTESYGSALVFGLLSRLFGGRARHVAKELYLSENVLRSPAKKAMFRAALSRVDRVVVSARSEIEAYADFLGIERSRVVFLPWAARTPLSPDSEDRGYVFAGGRALRDWKTLFAAARSIPFPFVVVATRPDVASLSPPPNVRILCDVSHREYLERLRGARIVVLPLAATIRSTGQVVALDAMAMRKPIVAADTPGILDYVRHEENCLLYRAGDPISLACQLQRLLGDGDLRQKLSEGAAASIKDKYNRAAYSKQLFQVLSELQSDPAQERGRAAETPARRPTA